METTERVWGITKPISVAPPTAAETHSTNLLLEELRRQNTFESGSETKKRFGKYKLPCAILFDLATLADNAPATLQGKGYRGPPAHC